MSRLNLPHLIDMVQHEPIRLWQCPKCNRVRATVHAITEMHCLDCMLVIQQEKVKMEYKAVVFNPSFLKQYVREAMKKERQMLLEQHYGKDPHLN